MRLASALLLFSASAGAQTLTELADQIRPSVVHLEALDDQGEPEGNATGFFISADGWVVTNHHVIDRAMKLRAVRDDGTHLEVLGVLADSKDADLAILKVEGAGHTPLELDPGTVKVGEQVVVLGSPLGYGFTFSSGIVSAIRDSVPQRNEYDRLVVKAPVLQITAPTTSGSSGSPVVNVAGKVVAVINGGFDTGNIEFAVRARSLIDLRDTIKLNAKPTPLGRKLPVKNLIISGVFFGLIALAFGYLKIRQRIRRTRPTSR
jgi:S1-C subfamily serine protease